MLQTALDIVLKAFHQAAHVLKHGPNCGRRGGGQGAGVLVELNVEGLQLSRALDCAQRTRSAIQLA